MEGLVDTLRDGLWIFVNIVRVMIWALGELVVQFYNTTFDTGRYLKQEPLITINAVGIAIALFALEQLLEKDGIATTDDHSQRIWRMVWPLRVGATAGLFHFASLFTVLIVRSNCERVCTTDGTHYFLALATNSTVFGVLLLVVAMIWAMVDIPKDRFVDRTPQLSY